MKKNEKGILRELEGRGYDVEYVVDDWILEDVLDDPFYNFKWFADFAKSKMKPLVKKYSLGRELVIKAAEVVIGSFIFNRSLKEQKKRIKFIISKSMDDSIDRKYEKEPLSLEDLGPFQNDHRKFRGQAERRFFNLMDRLGELDDGGDGRYVERVMLRNQAFECSYLCLCTEEPKETFYILWGLIDWYHGMMKPLFDAYEREHGTEVRS